ncbi:hypothetical protein FGE12_06525 [Aggregicoccus sp. 17bor-14]|uniref:hypothetical protein n=1 Tax=Myxococcaceae TaxID=31 RepID=UPI00129C9FBF|nr:MULTISPECIES: hypothetical protein [Myxococcaceae]MBF5042043.1 hypothetical protein [Simulacricoccus sp. 17bor-14]MRI87822.1 hypothetical protein [Aggregicoccus sp. 17bor-14]
MVEQDVGSFEALHTPALSTGIVYQVYVSEQRLVAVKIGGQFDGGKAFTMQLGLIGAIIAHFLDKRVQRKRAVLRQLWASRPLDELRALDPKNFELPFEALTGVELKKAKLGFLGGSQATLLLRKSEGKPMELTLQSKAAAMEALRVLEQRLQGRLQVDPRLRAA